MNSISLPMQESHIDGLVQALEQAIEQATRL